MDRLGGWGAEEPVHEQRKTLIESVHQRHHDADKHEHDARVAEQLSASGGYDLAQLNQYLSDEQRDTGKRATPFGTVLSRVGDDVLTGLVDHFACHTHNLSSTSIYTDTEMLQGGQDLNLPPAVLETAALPIEPPPYVRNP